MAAAQTEISQQDSFFSWEAFLLGGFSILVCLACWTFTDKGDSVNTISQLAFGLAFIVNHPHFLSSYCLLYRDFRKNIFQKFSYFWAAVLAPLTLAGGLFYALSTLQGFVLGYFVTTMYFLVGWHYTKQVFGCIIVTSARRKMYFSNFERQLLLANLFSIWALSFVRGNTGTFSGNFYGVTYSSLNFPPQLTMIMYASIALTGLAVLFFGIKKYIVQGQVLNSSAIAAYAALYVWYLPAFAHKSFAYLIPLFHSLQYLVFVWSFKTNQVEARTLHLKGSEKRAAWVQQFVSFMFVATFLGAISFEFLPNWLDSLKVLPDGFFGQTPFLASFLLFINIHHYFIDNVIWRSSNEEVKKYLFAPPSECPIVKTFKKSA